MEEQNQNPNEELNIDALLGEESQNDAAPTPEGVDMDSFNSNLSAISGGKFNSFDQVRDLASYRDKYTNLEKEYNALVEKSSINPYANNLMERANGLYAEGKSTADVVRFLEVQDLDLGSLSPEDAIKRNKQLQTGWSAGKINEWFDVQYPQVDPDSENAEFANKQRRFKIEEEAQAAVAGLDQMKVDLQSNMTDTSEQEARFKHYSDNVGKLTEAVIGRVNEINLDLNIDKGLDYKFDFNIPKNDPRMKQVVDAVKATAVQQGIKFDEHGLKTIQQLVKSTAKIVFFDDILRATLSDARASIEEAKVKEVSNSAPVKKGSGGSGTPKKKGGPAPVVNQGGVSFV